jgi:mannonate dehydratase
VRIGPHPDDPPVPVLGGVPRVFRNFEGYQRAVEIADSENFGLCFCIGTWAEGGEMVGKDVMQTIEYFGPRKRIYKCHFRNVDQPLPRFQEEFVDTGYLDMYAVMKTLQKVKFDGVIIPDHVPQSTPANNAFTVGYMKAMRDRVVAEARSA